MAVHKFRSMEVDAEAGYGTGRASRRATPRDTNRRAAPPNALDELPQLWNV